MPGATPVCRGQYKRRRWLNFLRRKHPDMTGSGLLRRPRGGKKATQRGLDQSHALDRALGTKLVLPCCCPLVVSAASVPGLDVTERRNVCFGLKKKFASAGLPNGFVRAVSGTALVHIRHFWSVVDVLSVFFPL
jgi:hypothetical protein